MILTYIDSDHHSHTMLSGHRYLDNRSSPMIAATAPLVFVPLDLVTKALSQLYHYMHQSPCRSNGIAKER